MLPETEKSIRMPCHYTSLKRQPTTWNRFGGLRKYVEISLCEAGKFYCEINYFICEITSRLLRDKFFYLRVEFFLLPRELRLVPRENFFMRMRIIFHPHENLFSSHQTVSPFASEIFLIASDCKSGRIGILSHPQKQNYMLRGFIPKACNHFPTHW